MKAIVIASEEQLKSIGIPVDDLQTNSEVTIIFEFLEKHPQHGKMAEIIYLYKDLTYHIPVKWLKIL